MVTISYFHRYQLSYKKINQILAWSSSLYFHNFFILFFLLLFQLLLQCKASEVYAAFYSAVYFSTASVAMKSLYFIYIYNDRYNFIHTEWSSSLHFFKTWRKTVVYILHFWVINWTRNKYWQGCDYSFKISSSYKKMIIFLTQKNVWRQFLIKCAGEILRQK